MIGSKYCPSCAERICPPTGRSTDILVIGEMPEPLDMQKGIPFSISPTFMTVGKVFRKELEKAGLSFSDFRVMNVWLHQSNNNENCFQAGYNLILEEAKGKKAILLIGSGVVDIFTEYKVSDVSGLLVDSAVLSCPNIMAMVNPSVALSRGVGEVRFAIGQWKKLLEKEDLI